MMKHLSFILVFALYTQIVFSQVSAYPNVEYTGLVKIVADGNSIVSLGTCDKATFSHDGGLTWSYMNADIDVVDIAMVPGTDGREVIVIDREEIYILNTETEEVTSAGVTSNSLISGRFEGMHFDGESIILIGALSIFKGALVDMTFEKIGDLEYSSSDRVRYTSLTDSYVWVGTDEGLLIRGDLESNSVSQIKDFEKDMRNFTMGTDEVGYASFSGESDFYKTSDGGISWEDVNSFSESATLYAYGEDVIISRNTNRLVISTDGGATSQYVGYMDYSSYSYLVTLFFTENDVMYVAGESSTILKSSDYGITFENLNPYSRESINTIDMNSSGQGLALGESNLVLITDDSGETWESVVFLTESTTNYFTGGVVTENGTRLILNDEGIHKIENGTTFLISEEYLNCIMHMPVDDSFIGVKYQGGSYIIRKSVDGGVTWNSKSALNAYGYYQAHNRNGIVVVSIDANEYAISKDNGETWEIRENPFDNGLFSIALFGENLGLVSSGYSLYKTSDGFETFEEISNGYGQGNSQIYSEDHYIFTSAQNFVTTVKESKDGGESWSVVDQYCSLSVNTTLHEDTYWMGQRGGHINFTKLDLSTSIAEIDFDNSLKLNGNILRNGDELNMELEKGEFAEIQIIDQTGQITYKNVIETSKTNSVSLQNLVSGIYFVRVRMNDRLYQNKFIIIE